MKFISLILISTLLLTITACSNTDELEEIRNLSGDVDAALVPYYEAFIQEGEERGLNIDLSDIPGSIRDIPNAGVAGTCQFNPDGNILTVDLPTWNQSDDDFREYIVFHELGHCFLERDHDNSTDNSNNCLSIMASGTTGCEITYGAATREDFLDELFGN